MRAKKGHRCRDDAELEARKQNGERDLIDVFKRESHVDKAIPTESRGSKEWNQVPKKVVPTDAAQTLSQVSPRVSKRFCPWDFRGTLLITAQDGINGRFLFQSVTITGDKLAERWGLYGDHKGCFSGHQAANKQRPGKGFP